MLRNVKTRTTDLTTLRSILLDESDFSKEIGNENNLKDFSILEDKDNINKSNLKNFSDTFSNKNVDRCMISKMKPKSKRLQDESTTRRPFFVSRINTHHKDNYENVLKSIDNEVSLQTNSSIYKSIHYKNITKKEEGLQLKYRQLTELLQKDIVARTAAICDESLNEARQLIQNSLATSRIISSFVTDTRSSAVNNNPFVPLRDVSVSSVVGATISDQSVKSFQDPFQPPVTNTDTNVYGYEATNPIRGPLAKCTTDNRLRSEEPFIQNWLHSKEKEEREQRRLKMRQLKIERAVTMDAERVLEQRKAASEEAFKNWCRQKGEYVRKESLNRSEEVRSCSPESDDEESLPQAGRQPRRNILACRRPQSLTRPKTTASFSIRRDLRMKLTGQRVELAVADTVRSGVRSQEVSLPARATVVKQRPQTAVPGPRQTDVTPTKPVTRRRSRRRSKTARRTTGRRDVTEPHRGDEGEQDDESRAKDGLGSVSLVCDYESDIDFED